MVDIPPSLLQAFDDIDRRAIDQWWQEMPSEAQADVARLCDTRLDSCFFGVIDDTNAVVPKVKGGRFVPRDDMAGWDEWSEEYFKYLLDHQELVIVFDPNERKFHTGCVQHRDAQECWRGGGVPSSFHCPFARKDCLMSPMKGHRIRRRLTNLGVRPTC